MVSGVNNLSFGAIKFNIKSRSKPDDVKESVYDTLYKAKAEDSTISLETTFDTVEINQRTILVEFENDDTGTKEQDELTAMELIREVPGVKSVQQVDDSECDRVRKMQDR